MRLPKRWVSVVLVAVAVMGPMQTPPMRPSVAQGQSGSDAPYIYYYSNDLNAWVIERADGTDRRLLGQDLMSEGTNAVGGPGWSPSGKVFAWTSYTGGVYGQSGGWNGWVISADGQNIIAHFGGTEDAGRISMQWSPSADLLMVAETGTKRVGPDGDLYFVDAYFTLLDVETGRIIGSLQNITFALEWIEIQWINDGQYAITKLRSTNEEVTQFYLFSPNGTIIERVFPYDFNDMPSPTGTLLINTYFGIVFVDLIEGTLQPIKAAWNFPDKSIDDYSGGYSVDWNSTGTQGLIQRAGIWFLDVASAEIRQITPLNGRGEASWSPNEEYVYVTLWSGETIPGRAYLVETATGRAFDAPYYDYGSDWEWVSDEQLLVYGLDWSFSSEGRSNDTFASFVEIPSGNTTVTLNLGKLMFLPTIPAVSPDFRYLAWVNEGPIIYDLKTSVVTTFKPNSHSFGTDRGGEISWHSSQEWLIEAKYASVTDGIGPYRWVSIMRPDGSQRRELTYCFNMTACIGWLPDRVDPSTLPAVSMPAPPPQIAPVQTINVGHWPGFLDWSPDGRLVIVDSANYDDKHFQVYDVWEGKPIAELEIGENQKPGWQLNSAGEYEAIAIDLEANERFRHSFGDPVISPDNRFAASFNPYPVQPIQIVDTESKEIVGELDTSASAVAFSPDGQYLAVGVSWDVEIWRVSDLIGAGVGEN